MSLYEPADYIRAKAERLDELKRHIKWVSAAIEYWGDDYAKTGAHFSQGMYENMSDLLSQLNIREEYLARRDVVVKPNWTTPTFS